MKRAIVLHPLFFVIYPMVFLYLENRGQVTVSQIYRSIIFGSLFMVALLVTIKLLSRNWHKAGIITSLIIVEIFSFGHLYNFLGEEKIASAHWITGGRLVVMYGLIFLMITTGTIFMLSKPQKITFILNIVSGFLLLMNLSNVVSINMDQFKRSSLPSVQESMVFPPENPKFSSGRQTEKSKPDIYFIILDGYGEQRVLEDLYGFDNKPFIDFLETKGFTIAKDSTTNYIQTFLSVASTLNMDYIDHQENFNPLSGDRMPTVARIKNSKLQKFLADQGYKIVALETGFEFTNLENVDLFIESPFSLNVYEQILINSTPAVLVQNDLQANIYRREVRSRFEVMPEVAKVTGPKFVFAHMVVPHPPFVFDASGNSIEVTSLLKRDGSHYQGTREKYLRQYTEQLKYINTLTEQMISGILKNSKTPPIIILQSDHGPGAYLDWESMENSCLKERVKILNAYYLPDPSPNIPSNITPVNSFRLVLATYFGVQLDRLENRSYYSTFSKPYMFLDVTDLANTCYPLETKK